MRSVLTGLAFLATGALTSGASVAGPALLFDAGTGQVLYAEDQDHQWHPASLTKVMTAYLTFEAIKAGKLTLETKIACSEAAFVQAPSKVGLPVGAELTVDTALQAVIVKSANDVSIMLAEAVSGSEQTFVELMNTTAKRLGMTRTTFTNPNGLPAPGQVTTARDLAKLSRAVLRDYPEYAHYWSMPEMRIGKRRLGSHNSLLKSFDGADGLKTGFICDSGFNVIASATRDGRRLMAVVLGAASGHERKIRAASLLDHGFQTYGWKQMFEAGSVDTMPVSADAKPVATVRDAVLSWDCGMAGRRAKQIEARQARAKAKQAKAEAKKLKAAKAANNNAKAAPPSAASDGSNTTPAKTEPAATTAPSTAKVKASALPAKAPATTP